VHNPEFHRRTKHIDVVYHFIREHQRQGDIDIRFVSTTQQFADLLTKALPADRFCHLRQAIGLLPCPTDASL